MNRNTTERTAESAEQLNVDESIRALPASVFADWPFYGAPLSILMDNGRGLNSSEAFQRLSVGIQYLMPSKRRRSSAKRS